MKAIQITFDETLLAELDASEEVRRDGRSAVLRRAAAEYLARRRRQEIADSYARAYADGVGLGDEFAGWEDQGQWPES
jgi:metal-responsive CopG/Arc/MetJ family transcriptional regulator